jgi:hypothetical protein
VSLVLAIAQPHGNIAQAFPHNERARTRAEQSRADRASAPERVMGEDEVFILILSVVLAGVGIGVNRVGSLHRLYFRDNPAPGIIRLGVLLAMAWIAFVIWRFADPSVTGIYVVFYLVMGYAFVKLFGQAVAAAFGTRTRIDAGERRNVPAALVIAAFTLATGLIFGGSLWGEADPVGDDEGGWWIPVSFFLLGWGVLLVAFGFFLRREQGRFADRIRRNRSFADARAAATFLLGSAVVLTDAVAGDFWGWRHGLLTFSLLAVMLLVHEIFASLTEAEPTSRQQRPVDPRRVLESGFYIGLAAVVWLLNRVIDTALGPG